MQLAVLVAFCVLVLQYAGAANILGLFILPSKSHHILGEALMRGFAKAGHNVTLVSSFNVQRPPKNFTHLVIEEMEAPIEEMKAKFQNAGPWELMGSMTKFQQVFVNISMASDAIKTIRTSGTKFEVVISDDFFNHVFFGLAHELGAKLIPFCGSHSTFANHITGTVAPYSFVPNLISTYTDRMTFMERVMNTVSGLGFAIINNAIIEPDKIDMYRQYFKNGPDPNELVKNVSLVFINTHVALETPRPYVPNMIQIGGYHIDEPKELPKELKTYLDSAKEGFIYCSFGSNVKPSILAKEKILAFTRSFANFPFKFLWKWDSDAVPEISSNVRTEKWLPQRDILAHPNIKLFITHGGLLSTTEAIVSGVPMIAIPFFGDQNLNAKTVMSGGFGIAITVPELTTEVLTAAIKEITQNPKYEIEVKKRQTVFLDRPMKPMDTAIYWVEHILRHGGEHLHCTGADLNFFQYYLIDVFAFIFAICYAAVKIVITSCRWCCCRKNKYKSEFKRKTD